MIVVILSFVLLGCLVACLGIAVRESRRRRRQERAEGIWSERQTFRAEMKLHELASNTFSSMMEAARQDDNGNWQR